jgi:hypothetical protein
MVSIAAMIEWAEGAGGIKKYTPPVSCNHICIDCKMQEMQEMQEMQK